MLRKEFKELNHFSHAYTNILLFSRYPNYVLLQPDHGGVTDEKAREVSVKLDFLLPGITYEAAIYADGPDADFETAPQDYTITKQTVTSETVLNLRMARSGGFAVSLRSLTPPAGIL